MNIRTNRIYTIITAIIIMAQFTLGSCTKDKPEPEIKAESISFSENRLYLKTGESIQADIQVLPENADSKDIVFSSDNPEIASVNGNGSITAISEGKTRITAELNGLTASCDVKVTPVYSTEYTVMIYGCGGGNLDDYIISNLNQLKEYGSTEKVKATALIKYSRAYTKKKGTKFYDLQGKDLVETEYAGSDLDMSDPQTLADFIIKSKTMYPANKYVLVTTNHGSEWDPENDIRKVSRAMLFDDNTSTALSIFGLAEGIRRSDEYFELVYPDLCLFGMLEFINELDDVCKYTLASSNLVIGAGGSFYDLLKDLNTGTDSEDCFRLYVDDVMKYWEKSIRPGSSVALDIALTIPSRINSVYGPIIKYKNRLMEIKSDPFQRETWKKIQNCANIMYFFDYLPGDKLSDVTDTDILDSFTKIADAADDQTLKDCVNELKGSFANFVVYESDRNSESFVDTPEGFSFGIQWSNLNSYNQKGFAKGYEASKFNQAVKWSEFLSME